MSTLTEEPKFESRTGVVRYDELFNQRTLQTVLRKTATDDQARKVNRKKPVVVVRRVINQRGQLEKTCYDIKTERVREVFRDIYKNAYNFQLSDARQEVSSANLFHARADLALRYEQELKKDPKSELVFELRTILDVVNSDLSEDIQDHTQIETEGRVSFWSLWMIFPPNTLIYRLHPMLQQHQVMRLLSCRYSKDNENRPIFVLNCDVVQDDGRSFGLSSTTIEIKDFPEATTIQDLIAYPLQLHPEAAKVRKHCITRGKKIAPIRQELFHTRGIAYKRKWGERWGEIKEDRFSAYGRVMIDAKTFRTFQPNDPIVVSVRRALDDSNGLAEDEYLICSPVLLGYCFGTKQWGGFAWENLSNVTWSEDAFSQLVLDPHQKRLVHALVHQHSQEAKASFDDIIAGKGKGIIGLLSGNPGCGKTLTAEAVAEVTRRPLYSVSAGELGIEADSVDRKLTSIFELAQTWRVVVLLDEADVFLYKRTANRLEQNALVAIFLRHLEYFEGIMILTTNMVEDFDMAFESRIHFSIRYPDLGYESRKAIWKTFLTKGMNSKDGSGPDQATIEQLARYHSLNGRQIKNTVSVAMSLAAEDKVPLASEHIVTVLETRKLWDDVKEGKRREPDDDAFFEEVKAQETAKQEPESESTESKQAPLTSVAPSKAKEFKTWTDQLLPFFAILMMPIILLCLRS